MPNFIDTVIKRKSVVKLKLQFSSSFIENLTRLLFAEEMLDGVVTVSIAGGSYHVMLPPSVVPKAAIEKIIMQLKSE